MKTVILIIMYAVYTVWTKLRFTSSDGYVVLKSFVILELPFFRNYKKRSNTV